MLNSLALAVALVGCLGLFVLVCIMAHELRELHRYIDSVTRQLRIHEDREERRHDR